MLPRGEEGKAGNAITGALGRDADDLDRQRAQHVQPEVPPTDHDAAEVPPQGCRLGTVSG